MAYSPVSKSVMGMDAFSTGTEKAALPAASNVGRTVAVCLYIVPVSPVMRMTAV